MSDSDDKKLKDLKSRLGLVAAGRPAATLVDPPADSSDSAERFADEGVEEAEPVSLEPADLEFDVATAGRKGPMVAVVSVLMLVALGIGYFLGGTFTSRDLSNLVLSNVVSVSERMNQKDGETQKTSFETIAAHKAAIVVMNDALEAYEKSAPTDEGGNTVYGGAITAQIMTFLEACEAYRERVELGAILPDGLYGKDFLGPAMRFSSKANQLATASQRLGEEREKMLALSSVNQERLADPSFGIVTLVTQEAVDQDGVTWSLGTLLKGVTLKPRQGTNPMRRPGQPRVDWLVDIPGKNGSVVVWTTRQIVEASVKSEILRPSLEQLQAEWREVARGIHGLNGIAESVMAGPFTQLLEEASGREAYTSF